MSRVGLYPIIAAKALLVATVFLRGHGWDGAAARSTEKHRKSMCLDELFEVFELGKGKECRIWLGGNEQGESYKRSNKMGVESE